VSRVTWLDVRRSPVREAAGAAAFTLVYVTAMLIAHRAGWDPQPGTRLKFELAGLATVLVLLLRTRFPLTTLLLSVTLYPQLYGRGDGLRTEFHVLPILLAAYTVAAGGARLPVVWTLLLAEFGATLMVTPPLPDLLRTLDPGDNSVWWNLHRYQPNTILLVQGMTALVVLLGRAALRQQEATAQLIAHNRELERLRGVETEQVVAAERTRIARELHDVVAHHISAVVIRAQAVDRVADSRPAELRPAVRWIAANGQETLAAIRHVVRVLRSTERSGTLAPQATLAALPDIAERLAAVGLPVHLRLPTPLPALPASVELAAVRIVQEALTNTLVHAGATHSRVNLRLEGAGLRVEVHDDGRASAPPTAPIRLLTSMAATRSKESALPASASALGGNGLLGMRERVASCGGTLAIGTSPLGGWLVTATLPIDPGVRWENR
jgi:signal transduction histidine kinase